METDCVVKEQICSGYVRQPRQRPRKRKHAFGDVEVEVNRWVQSTQCVGLQRALLRGVPFAEPRGPLLSLLAQTVDLFLIESFR